MCFLSLWSLCGAVTWLVHIECAAKNVLNMRSSLGRPMFKESCQFIITSLGNMFQDFKMLAKVALVILYQYVTAEQDFCLQNQIKTQ